MRTNSIMDDPEPWKQPETKAPPKPKKSDWEKLATSKDYPVIKKYIDERKVFYQRYLPSAVPVENMNSAESAENWKNAVIIITELENLEQIIMSNKRG